MNARKLINILVAAILLLNFNSCISYRKLAYLQDKGQRDSYPVTEKKELDAGNKIEYRIMPFDNLFIRVITPDPQWSSLFNTMPVGAGGAVTEESVALIGYPVDVNGNIDIPFVGNVNAAGKTLKELKIELDSVFKNYVTDAAISVRLVNNYVSILGEVRIPGRFPLTKDRVNVFEALSMAGDMVEYSNRQKVQLIRPSPYGPIIREFSLSDRSILTSEFYYIMPNDIINVQPVSGRMFAHNTSIYSLFLSTITSILVLVTYFSNLQR